MAPRQIEGEGRKANTPPFDNLFLNFFKKHKQRGDPLELFYGPSLQIELDAPLCTYSMEGDGLLESVMFS